VRLQVNLAPDAAALCAERSRGTPRMSLRILRRVRDLAQVQQKETIDAAVAVEGLQRLRIDALGLEEVDRRLLRALVQRGEAVGLKTLAAMIDEAEDTLEEVLEPHLIRCGLLARTPRGRVATARTYEHLGLEPPKTRPGELPFA
jgi:Holliday junction DNA helicase RuvB